MSAASCSTRTRRSAAFIALALAIAPAAFAARNVTLTDASGSKVEIRDAGRIVCLNGQVTEIVYALGAGARVVGVDASSTYPAAAKALPHVGYQRTIAAEGVLALKPTLILANDEAGPPAVIDALRSSGVPLLRVGSINTADGARARIRMLAKALSLESNGDKVIANLDRSLDAAAKRVAATKSHPRVLFVFARGAASVMVAGTASAPDEVIRLAGGVNAISGFDGFKPLTAEAAAAAAPDVILVPSAGLESLGGMDALLALPGLSLTPAGKARRVIAMDTQYLLGFGPRLGDAVSELATALHPELTETP